MEEITMKKNFMRMIAAAAAVMTVSANTLVCNAKDVIADNNDLATRKWYPVFCGCFAGFYSDVLVVDTIDQYPSYLAFKP